MSLQILVVMCPNNTCWQMKLKSRGKFCAKQIRRSRKECVQTLYPKSTHSSSIKIHKRNQTLPIFLLENSEIGIHPISAQNQRSYMLLNHTHITIFFFFFFFFFFYTLTWLCLCDDWFLQYILSSSSSASILILQCIFSYLIFSLPRLPSLSSLICHQSVQRRSWFIIIHDTTWPYLYFSQLHSWLLLCISHSCHLMVPQFLRNC